MKKKLSLFTLIISILVTSILIFNNISSTVDASDKSNARFKLYQLSVKGNSVDFGQALYASDNFNDVKKAMNKELSSKKKDLVITDSQSLSPTKIVAADRAYVQSIPVRRPSQTHGSLTPSLTLKIYRNQDFNAGGTYIGMYYLMFLHDTHMYKNSLQLEIEISGKRGFIDINQADIIPLIYVENKIPIMLGGNGSYNSYEKNSYSKIIEPITYSVRNNNGLNEISLNINLASRTNQKSSILFGLAPSWLGPGTYYSFDSIHFFKDIDLTIPVAEGKEFYAYYQWLPLRTRSNYDGEDFSKIPNIDSQSALYGAEQAFREVGDQFGINPLLLLAQAIHESGWGKSTIAKKYNNLFGYLAYDSNPDNARVYDTVYDSIAEQGAVNLRRYVRPRNANHYGASFGNKDSGVTVKYASDPYYGEKVAQHAYAIDKRLGFKDHNAYTLAKTVDKTKINVYKDINKSSLWYETEGSPLVNQIIVNLGQNNNMTKTLLYIAINSNGDAVQYIDEDGVSPYYVSDLTKEFGYIDSKYVQNVDTSEYKRSKITSPRIGIGSEYYEFTLKNDTKLKRVWKDDSKTLLTIPKKEKVYGYYTDNGWISINYYGQLGYIKANEVVKENELNPDLPSIDRPKDSELSTYFVDLSSSVYNSVHIRELPTTSSSSLGGHNHGDVIKAKKHNGEWYIVKVNESVYGFVHANYVSSKDPIPTPNPYPDPSYRLGDVNNDGVIDEYDMMAVKRHYLNLRKLNGSALKAADANNDGKIDEYDMMAIKRHYLGIKELD